MLSYAVVVAKAGGLVPPTTLAMLRDPDPDDLPFSARYHHCWVNPRGSVAVGAWQDTIGLAGGGDRWHQSDRGVTLLAGTPWQRDEPWDIDRPWAAQLEDGLRDRSIEAIPADLLGVFTLISLDVTGRGFVAGDPLGISLVYLGANAECDVLSSRASLAARLLTPTPSDAPRRDAIGACWLAFSPYPIGASTGFERVEVAPAGHAAEIDPTQGIRLRPTTQPPWSVPRAAGGHPSELLDELRSDIIASIRAAREVPGADHVAELTGGKDSRLILAMLIEEGLEREFDFVTTGRPDLPDVMIAKQLAEKFGLRHAVNSVDEQTRRQRASLTKALQEAGYADVQMRELSMRLSVGSWSAMRNVSEARAARPPRTDRLLLSGACGEALRTNFPGTARLESMSEAGRFASEGLNWGESGILRREIRAHYDAEVRRALLDGFAEGDKPQDAIDAFYIRNRLRRWFGTAQEADGSNRVFPLYSLAGIRAAFAIGVEARHDEWLHYQLIRETSESLARVPFDKRGWADRLTGPVTDSGPKRPVRTGPQGRPPAADEPQAGGPAEEHARTVGRDRRKRLEATDLEIMRRYLLEDASNPAFEVLDRGAVSDALRDFGQQSESTRIQLYGALTAAIWLGGYEIAPVPKPR